MMHVKDVGSSFPQRRKIYTRIFTAPYVRKYFL